MIEYKQPDVVYFFQLFQNLLLGNVLKLDGRIFFVMWEDNSPVIYEHIKDTKDSFIAHKMDFTITEFYDFIMHTDIATVVHEV